MDKYIFTIAEAMESLDKEENKRFVKMLEHGSISIEYFAPKAEDTQQPHSQDELYVIASGTSKFYRNREVIKCRKGDVIFVPAKMEHHFENFSDDFATWVIFCGTEGGELAE